MAARISLKPPENHGYSSHILCVFMLYLAYISGKYFLLSTLCSLGLVLIKTRTVTEEEVMLVPYVGLQYTVKYCWGRSNTTFVHWENIKDVLINEVFNSQRVLYLLTVLIIRNSNEYYQLPLFTSIKPNLDKLEIIYQDLQAILRLKQ